MSNDVLVSLSVSLWVWRSQEVFYLSKEVRCIVASVDILCFVRAVIVGSGRAIPLLSIDSLVGFVRWRISESLFILKRLKIRPFKNAACIRE